MVWLVGLVVVIIIVCWVVCEGKRREKEKRRQEEEEWAQLAGQREANRQALAGAIVTANGSHISGRRIENHLGAVFSKWQRVELDSLPVEYYMPGYDALQMHDLVELTLKYRAKELGANAIIHLRMRTFRNGCEGSGDAVLTTT